MTSRQAAALLTVNRFGNYQLSEGVRPAFGAPAPRIGYRSEIYYNRKSGLRIPCLAAAVSREMLADVFLALLAPLGDVVEVALETSHRGRRRVFWRHDIDRPVFESHFWEFEDMLLNDGCTGIAVVNRQGTPIEIQLDEHKVIICYARNRRPFRHILDQFHIPHRTNLNLVCEAPHFHHSTPTYARGFRQLALRLGAGRSVEARPV